MNAPKFTPGPWFAVPTARQQYQGQNIDMRVRSERDTIALVIETSAGDSNINLITAAPDLFNALFVLAAAAEARGIPVDAARAALAKAVQP
jgi:hypothetical protein